MLITHFLPFSSLLPLIISLVFIRVFKGKEWWLFLYIVYQVLKAIAYYYTFENGIQNTWLTHIESVVPTSLLALYLIPSKLPFNIDSGLMVRFIISLSIILTSFSYLLGGDDIGLSVIPLAISSIIIAIMAFIQMKKQGFESHIPLNHNPKYIVSASLFGYSLASVVFYAQYDNLIENSVQSFFICLVIMLCVYSVLMILISLSIFKMKKWYRH